MYIPLYKLTKLLLRVAFTGQQHDDSNFISEAASCGATTSSAGPATARATAGLPTAATSTGPFRRTTAKQSDNVPASTATVS